MRGEHLELTLVVSFSTSSIRAYAATQAVEEPQVASQEDDFFTPELAIPSSSSPIAQEPVKPAEIDTPQQSSSAVVPPTAETASLVPDLSLFSSLKGRIDHDVLKALTVRPFKLTAMSEVQKRVLGMMPELSGGKLRGEAKEAGESEDREVVEERQDLLVKVSNFSVIIFRHAEPARRRRELARRSLSLCLPSTRVSTR
jgi:ATP-dependent RNA helicase MSS116